MVEVPTIDDPVISDWAPEDPLGHAYWAPSPAAPAYPQPAPPQVQQQAYATHIGGDQYYDQQDWNHAMMLEEEVDTDSDTT